MKGIFHPDKRYEWEYPMFSLTDFRGLDPAEDKYYLEYAVLRLEGVRLKRLMQKLGISELPEKTVNCDDTNDTLYEEYFVLREQVAREPDAEVLKEAVYEAPAQMARFAFCRLTNYSYPPPRDDAYSYRTYECGWKEGMTTEDVIDFCREMISVCGPFAGEAKEILADPPKDHIDSDGKRMASHERAVSEPPYVRRERTAPFRKSEQYEQDRAEVLSLEARGLEALAAGDREQAALLFLEMSRKSEQLGKYTQRWESLDDYARSCIAMAEACSFDSAAADAAVILRRLIRECPEEKTYRDHLQKAETVYRKAVKETALQTGFADEVSPIVFTHSFEPEYAEVICGLLEKRFRERGGRRAIEFRHLKAAQSSKGPGDICCCDLLTMTGLYHDTGELSGLLPFIDTGDVFPFLLEQGRIGEDVCGLPVLVFAGTPEHAGDSGGSTPAAGQAAGFRTYFAFMNRSAYGLKGLDCLDLMMLMTDCGFLFDVCRACSAEDGAPHVFPASRTAFARLAEKDPGYKQGADRILFR